MMKFQIGDGPIQEFEPAKDVLLASPSEDGDRLGGNFQQLFREADVLSGAKGGRAPIFPGGRRVQDIVLQSQGPSSRVPPSRPSDVSVLRSDEVYVIPSSFESGMQIDLYAPSSSTISEIPATYTSNDDDSQVHVDWDDISATVKALDDGGSSAQSRSSLDMSRAAMYTVGTSGVVMTNLGPWSWSMAHVYDGTQPGYDDGDEHNRQLRDSGESEPLARLFFGPVFEDDIKTTDDFESLVRRNRERASKRMAQDVEGQDGPVDLKNLSREDRNRYLEGQRLSKLRKHDEMAGSNINTAKDFERRLISRMRDQRSEASRWRGRGKFLDLIEHHFIASSHRNCKADLTQKEVLNFHAPRLTRRMKLKPWKVTPQKTTDTMRLEDRLGNNQPEELSLLAGEFVCIEYSEERPPLMTNLGMASVLINFFRTETAADGENGVETLDAGGGSKALGFRKKASRRRPKHIEMLELKKSSQQDRSSEDSSVPMQKLGKTEILDENEKFEFLGELPRGTVQSCIKNRCFRAPLYHHNVPSTDFLLVPVQDPDDIDRDKAYYELRTIPHLLLAGQMEPLRIVHKPSAKFSDAYKQFVQLRLIRILEQRDDAVPTEDFLTRFYTSTHLHQRNPLKEDMIRKLLRGVGIETVPNEWQLKESFDIYQGSDDVAKQIEPEEVCVHESQMAADYNLERVGITNIDLGRLEAWLIRMNALERYRSSKLQEVKALLEESSLQESLTELVKILTRRLDVLRHKRQIGRYIFERLICAPWNTTDAFLNHSDAMELDGPADPSGVGEGFSFYFRPKQVAPSVVNKNEKKIDLRKINQEKATEFLVNAGLKRSDLEQMDRWTLISYVEYLSRKGVGANIGIGELQKYAREHRNEDGVDRESYIEQCQGIWERQTEALSKRTFDDDDDDGDFDFDALEGKARSASPAKALTGAMSSGNLAGKKGGDEKMPDKRNANDAQERKNPILRDKGLQQAMEKWQRPMSVTKRTTRTVRADGSEFIEVKFIFGQGINLRQRSETSVVRRRMSISNREREVQPCDSELNDSEEEPVLGDDAPGQDMTLKLDVIQNMAKRSRNADVGEGIPMRRQPSLSRRSASDQEAFFRNARLPAVMFAAELESILMEQWTPKRSWPFIDPINYDQVPTYKQKVKKPIWLREIREKIGRFEYTTVDGFIRDFELLAANAATFNGSDHKLAKSANSIRNAIRTRVNLDRDQGLPDKLRILEQVMLQKRAFFMQRGK